MRSGTTWIYEYLRSRADVALPRHVKETNFFDRHYDRGLEWYASQFAGSGVVAEVASTYFHSEVARKRILESLPSATISIVVRDPLDRAWSHFLHLRRKGRTTGSLREAVSAHPEIIEASRYSVYVPRWQSDFYPKAISLLRFDKLESDVPGFVDEVCKAMAIRYLAPSGELSAKINPSTVAPRPALARVAARVSTGLRSSGLHAVVNAAKFIGLNKVFFGGPSTAPPVMSQEDRDWLRELLRDEHVWLQAVVR